MARQHIECGRETRQSTYLLGVSDIERPRAVLAVLPYPQQSDQVHAYTRAGTGDILAAVLWAYQES